MGNRYCLDANIFIQSKNGPYGLDFAPSFWAFLDLQAQSGILFSSTEVYRELVEGKDELEAWVRARKNEPMFVAPDEVAQKVYADIAEHVVKQYPQQQAQKFLSGADGWVIAQAKTSDAIVITHEVKVEQNSNKPKIPNVCEVFGVAFMNLYQMLRMLGAKF
jgi:hypothetical protein